MSNPNPPTRPSRGARWFFWGSGLALAAFGLWLATHATVVAGGDDSSGYLNSARLLAGGQPTAELRVPAEFGPAPGWRAEYFQPLGFVARADHTTLAPKYASGLPLHLAAASLVLGWEAGPLLIGVGAALAALVLCHLLGRDLGLDRGLAASGVVMLGAFPVFLFTSIQPLSDTLATTWSLAALWAARRSARGGGWAAFAGAAFAMAVLVRATNIVLLPALLVWLGVQPRRLGAFLLGGLPGAVWLLGYNHAVYGGALRSGYVALHEAFAFHHGPGTMAHFAQWLVLLLPAPVLLLAPGALWSGPRRDALALLLAFAGLAVVYVFYEISHEVWWCLRFLLPGVPALILAGLLVWRDTRPPVRRTAAVVFSAWAVALSLFWTDRLHVLLVRDYEAVYRSAALRVRELVPANALVAASSPSGALFYYTDLAVLRWDLLPPEQFKRLAALATRAQRPIFALLFDEFEDRARRDHLPGEWKRIDAVNNLSLWQYVGPAPGAPSA